jgi:hypothetical protein
VAAIDVIFAAAAAEAAAAAAAARTQSMPAALRPPSPHNQAVHRAEPITRAPKNSYRDEIAPCRPSHRYNAAARITTGARKSAREAFLASGKYPGLNQWT